MATPTAGTVMWREVSERDLRREFRVLLEVAGDKKADLSELITDPALDWDYLLAAATFHGLLPALAPRLLQHSSRVPERIRRQLRSSSQRAVEAALALSGELVRILRSLNAANVTPLPFKGPALAAELWGNFMLRQSMDIDLLVRPAELGQAVEVLQKCGYTPDSDWKRLFSSSVELRLVKPGMPPLELQWGITPRCFAVDCGIEACWQRAAVSEFGGQRTVALAPEDLMLILCIHGWKHTWNRLVWIADIARLTRKSPGMDWQGLRSRAKATGTEGILGLGVLLALTLFPVPITYELEDMGVRQRHIEKLAHQSIGYMQRLDQPSYVAWHRYMLAARERKADRVRHVTRFLLTPGVGDWEAVRLPKFVTPLYRLVRLARVGQVAAEYALRRA